MEKKSISKAVIKRLPVYHRNLRDLMDNGVIKISSRDLSDIIGFTASQIRQDLNNFGGFGQQGYGYNIKELYEAIGKILGLNKAYNVIIIGAGNIGQALANYTSFDKFGFNLKAMFDVNPKLIGIHIRNIEVFDIDRLDTYLETNSIDIAYICTNKSSAPKLKDVLVKKGVKGIWNFTPIDLKSDENEDVKIQNVHLIDHLFRLSYFISDNEK